MTKDKILAAACRLACGQSISLITRRQIAKAAGVGNGTVNYYFNSMDELRSTIIDQAIQTENMDILARLFGDPKITWRLKPALKSRIAAFIATR